jgi:phenylacetic acid degradation operon negative regulatory protein
MDMVKSNVELHRPQRRRLAREIGAAREIRAAREIAAAREIGAASARSLLLTVLGEFVLPAGEPSWTAAFVAALGLLGVEEKATRQALARMAAEGWVEPSRSGRRTCWRLTPAGRELLATGAERIYGFSSPARRGPAWDGRWLVIVASAPDGSRQLRHLLRTRLAWSGLGSLTPGVWVSPHPDRQPEVRQVLQDLGVAGAATFFVASLGELGDPKRIAGLAWNLAKIEARYQEFIGQVRCLRPQTRGDTFTALVRLVQEWRRFPLLDPGLPRQLLPDRWTGAEAAALFRGRRSQWKTAADAAWRDLASRC